MALEIRLELAAAAKPLRAINLESTSEVSWFWTHCSKNWYRYSYWASVLTIPHLYSRKRRTIANTLRRGIDGEGVLFWWLGLLLVYEQSTSFLSTQSSVIESCSKPQLGELTRSSSRSDSAIKKAAIMVPVLPLPALQCTIIFPFVCSYAPSSTFLCYVFYLDSVRKRECLSIFLTM